MRDTIEMAREAGIIHPEMVSGTIKAFEALVRADERALAAPVQEPVAHINQNGVIHEAGYEWGPTNTLTPLYTTPPAAQRQWVRLTVEQMFEAIRPLYSSDKVAWLAVNHSKDEYRAIEAKLKERNA
jgi:hypothetical protein